MFDPSILKTMKYDELRRLNRRCWKRVDNRYGKVSWDWRTLQIQFPGFYAILYPLHAEIEKRKIAKDFY